MLRSCDVGRALRLLGAALWLAAGCEPYGCPDGYSEVMGRCLDADGGGPVADAGDAGMCVPTAETCNGRDDDCDGATDGPNAARACVDVDRAVGRGCTAGECIITECMPGLDDCDRIYANGCETDLARTSSHCGVCGSACDPTEACVEATCRPLPIHSWDSVATPAGTASVSLFDLAIDPAGGLRAVGTMSQGELTFGSSFVRVTAATAGLILSVSADGAPLWAAVTDGGPGDRLTSVTVDAAGNTYVGGWESESVLPMGQGSYAFVGSWSAAGVRRWTARFGESLQDQDGNAVFGVAVDSAGQLFAAGEVRGSIRLGTELVRATGDGFVLQLRSTDGALVRSVLAQRARPSTAFVDAAGNAYIGGSFSGTAVIGERMHTATATDGFVWGLDNTLATRWVQTVSGSGDDAITDIASGGADTIVVTGEFRGSLSIAGSLLAADGTDALVVRSSASTGVATHARAFGGAGADTASRVSSDDEGRFFVGITTNAALRVMDATLDPLGGSDLVLVALDPELTPLWTGRFGGVSSESVQGLVSTGSSLQVATTLSGRANLGGATIETDRATAIGVVSAYRAR